MRMATKAPRTLDIALTAVMTASTAAVTMVTSIPFPPTKGYFNLGDAVVMLSGLLFGARLGGIAGGIGSALSDALLGYPYFAPLTLIIKGTEGFLTGLIGSNRKLSVKVAGVVAGAIAMMSGYFLVETPIYGFGAAFAELITANWIQVSVGGAVALAVTQGVLRAYPKIMVFAPSTRKARSGVIMIVAAAVILVAIVAVYVWMGVSP